MKKTLLLIVFTLTTLPFLYAQAPSSRTLRAADPLPKGFTYANRAISSTAGISAGGPEAADYYTVGAMELPLTEGLSIEAFSFITHAQMPHGKVFLLSRPTLSKIGSYTIEQVEEIQLKAGTNRYAFKTPVAMEAGKAYALGYECLSSGEIDDQGKKPVTFYPLGFVSTTLYFHEANLVNIKKLSEGSFVGKVGSRMEFLDFRSTFRGNIAIVAHLKDPENKLDNMLFFESGDLPTAAAIGTAIPSSNTRYSFEVLNLGFNPVNKLQLSIKKPDGTVEKKTYEKPLQHLQTTLISYQLGEITTPGRGEIEFSLEKVNDKENGCINPLKTKRFAEYILFPKGKALLRKEVLIERFTEEASLADPDAYRKLQEACSMLEKKGIKPILAAHHCGYAFSEKGDFLTLPESRQLLPFFTAPSTKSTTPAIALNRAYDYMSGPFYGISYLSRWPEAVVSMVDRVNYFPSEARIDTLFQDDHLDGTRTITVKGTDLSETLEAEKDLYISIYRIENGIKAQQQKGLYGVETNFIHNDVIREFVTPVFGKQITQWEGNRFTVDIENVKVDANWEKSKMKFVVFIHRSLKNKKLSMRYVFSSHSIGLDEHLATREVSIEQRPVAHVKEGGEIVLLGSYDHFELYDMAGQLIAINSSPQLPAGVYIVKASLGNVDYVSKVTVGASR